MESETRIKQNNFTSTCLWVKTCLHFTQLSKETDIKSTHRCIEPLTDILNLQNKVWQLLCGHDSDENENVKYNRNELRFAATYS